MIKKNPTTIFVTRYIRMSDDMSFENCVYVSYKQRMIKFIWNNGIHSSWEAIKNYKMEKLMLILEGCKIDRLEWQKLAELALVKKLLKIKGLQ